MTCYPFDLWLQISSTKTNHVVLNKIGKLLSVTLCAHWLHSGMGKAGNSLNFKVQHCMMGDVVQKDQRALRWEDMGRFWSGSNINYRNSSFIQLLSPNNKISAIASNYKCPKQISEHFK